MCHSTVFLCTRFRLGLSLRIPWSLFCTLSYNVISQRLRTFNNLTPFLHLKRQTTLTFLVDEAEIWLKYMHKSDTVTLTEC